MEITYWYGPPRKFLNADTYEDVKNAGFTLGRPNGKHWIERGRKS